MQFIQGQIIPIATLNKINDYIIALQKDPTNTIVVNQLIAEWEAIPPNTDDTNIQDDIDRIIAKQNTYINK